MKITVIGRYLGVKVCMFSYIIKTVSEKIV